MLLFILTVYITIGVVSAFTNLCKWVFRSMIWAIPMLPFIFTYQLLFGNTRQRADALIVLKVVLLAAGLYAVLFLFITVLQS